jgi:hypothetical protein
MLHVVLLAPSPLRAHLHTTACPFAHIRVRMCANGHAVCWRKEYPVENILLTLFFVESGKWETHPYIDRLPLPPMRDAHS